MDLVKLTSEADQFVCRSPSNGWPEVSSGITRLILTTIQRPLNLVMSLSNVYKIIASHAIKAFYLIYLFAELAVISLTSFPRRVVLAALSAPATDT